MLKAWNIIINNDDRLLKMMSDSLTIYDHALYIQRQAYFETKEQGTIKTYSYNQLWDKVKNEDKLRESKLDTNIKQYIVKQVTRNWLSWIKATMSYRKSRSNFTGCPKMPNYLYKSRNYNIIYIDSSRFRKKDEETNSFRIPCSDYRIFVPDKIKLRDVRQVTVQKHYDKIKINIIYEDREVIRNKYDNNSCIGIDLGVNNLMAITSNDKPFSYVINGRPLKSINQYYNKKLAEYRSDVERFNKKETSKRIRRLTMKRNNKINHYLHCASKQIINFCVNNGIEKIVVGHNAGWKQDIRIGHINNQNFVQIPFNTLINQLVYKSMKYTDLSVVIVEESYTSKADHIALEEMKHHEKYLGRRVKRGLFKSSTGKLLNTDINGAIGIMRKGNVISDVQLMGLGNRGDVVSPKVFKLNL